MRAALRRALVHGVWIVAVLLVCLASTFIGGGSGDALLVSWLASTACCVAVIGYMAWRRGSPHVVFWALAGLLGVAGLLIVGLVMMLGQWERDLDSDARRSQ